jgi:hypothetical protein
VNEHWASFQELVYDAVRGLEEVRLAADKAAVFLLHKLGLGVVENHPVVNGENGRVKAALDAGALEDTNRTEPRLARVAAGPSLAEP